MLMISFLLACAAVIVGLLVLVWSADRFVDGAAATARHFGMPMLLVGMIVVGFGTSAPEMLVSAIAALQGNPAVALGNAYGSNIANLGLILGLAAIIAPIAVSAEILRRQLPLLLAVSGLSAWLLADGNVSRLDSILLLGIFAAIMAWTIRASLKAEAGRQAAASAAGRLVANDGQGQEDALASMPLSKALLWLCLGLVLLVASSRLLVWGAVELARGFGVSDLLVGLTIVAVGTSLPELASSVVAARKGESEIAIGNVVGSNLFNTLVVVGIAGSISPMSVEPMVLTRDLPVMLAMTAGLLVLSVTFTGKKPEREGKSGRIGRLKGLLLLVAYLAYTAFLIRSAWG